MDKKAFKKTKWEVLYDQLREQLPIIKTLNDMPQDDIFQKLVSLPAKDYGVGTEMYNWAVPLGNALYRQYMRKKRRLEKKEQNLLQGGEYSQEDDIQSDGFIEEESLPPSSIIHDILGGEETYED